MPNRLGKESSPYLKQHAQNPIDWYAWGEEAFAKAVAEDKPILLSIGYSSCHWCHVMAHESFEDADVAKLVNAYFVSIKVDREELPDVDDTYMTALQLSGARGGWPMTLFLTPNRVPFYAATYLPKEDRGSISGFVSVCEQLAEAWQMRRVDVMKAADQYDHALRSALETPPPPPTSEIGEAFLNRAVERILEHFDPENGGFGGAPKFPPHAAIKFLTLYATSELGDQKLRESAIEAASLTLQKMVRGGIRDFVGGGFHRYSTDAEWLVPHFEKMLYDNALMIENLKRGLSVSADASMENAMVQTADWVEREMVSKEGEFYSALDADSDGEEGSYYVWTEAELDIVLEKRSNEFKNAFHVRPKGNFRDESTGRLTGANILHGAEDETKFKHDRGLLFDVRCKREPPEIDTKALVGWNGLMIGSLALMGRTGISTKCAEAILDAERLHGRLPRQIVKGRPKGDAYLEDYAYFISALFQLSERAASGHERQGERRNREIYWHEQALRLKDKMVELFYDEANGGFFSTSGAHGELFGRTKPVFDQPIPSANAVALHILIESRDLTRARQTAEGLVGWMERAPMATEALLTSVLELLKAGNQKQLPISKLVKVELHQSDDSSDGKCLYIMDIDLPRGHHLNGPEIQAPLIRVSVSIEEPLKFSVDYGTIGGIGGGTIYVTVEPDPEITFFNLTFHYQVCSDTTCFAPEEQTFHCSMCPA